jgi:hypothetical protein
MAGRLSRWRLIGAQQRWHIEGLEVYFAAMWELNMVLARRPGVSARLTGELLRAAARHGAAILE